MPGCSWLSGCAGGAVATFDPAAFIVTYPQWATTTTPDQLQSYFDIATMFLRNDGSGPVKSATSQLMLLNLLTAHITQLTVGATGTGAPGIVGRISSASEGSVSVGTDYPDNPNNAWFVQTPMGSSFWAATAAYRMAKYRPGPTRFGTGIGRGWMGRRF